MDASAGGGGDSTGKGEDEDESSSSSVDGGVQTTLDEFRERWQQELKKEPGTAQNVAVAQQDQNQNLSVEQRARALFLEGSEMERVGKVFEAMRLYRRAVQLVPDIEFRVYEKRTPAKQASGDVSASSEIDALSNELLEVTLDEDDENLENVDLVLRFQNLLAKSRKLFERASGDRGLIVTSAHFSDLPMEVILYILRWVVSSDLDLRSMERFGRVCRGFYLLARDPEIWRRACVRLWGVNVGNLKGSPFASWREMYINRPRVHFHGCYISRTSYLRYGENSFQDQFYRPVQLVEYYRYFRFFADGSVLMLTSAEEPQSCVGKLKPRSPVQNEILKGHYRLRNDELIIAVQRKRSNVQSQRPGRKKEIEAEFGQQTLYLELGIVSTAKRAFSQLHWRQYSMVQLRNNQETTTTFELNSSKYPTLFFSRVKSYHQESEGPLK
ncbi:F-box only protein 9 [Culex quinquefasciatus]|uniref:F-box only protein 9 n=1 Tax=Culex quinquefasciatus TaxID=7176 RepID=B0X0N5_CULQU|nr:F-box only protein 9 [Culex quinquefasciatus]|eukprot:XP_001863207.1 F-box only protein 9 [Culex quinquefasciatus]